MIKLTCPEQGVHYPWLPRVTRALEMLGLSYQEIFEKLREATSTVQHRKISEAEIKDAIALIRGKRRDSISAGNAVYEPEYLQTVAARITAPVEETYLESRSQFTCWNRTPAGFLHKLFQPGEHVWLTTNPRSSEGEIWTHDGHNQRFDELEHLVTGHIGVWFLTNPVDAELHSVERRKSQHNPDGLSFSTLECITSWRFSCSKPMWLPGYSGAKRLSRCPCRSSPFTIRAKMVITSLSDSRRIPSRNGNGAVRNTTGI